VERNPARTPLVARHELGVPLAGLGMSPVGLQALDRRGSRAVGLPRRKARWLSPCH